LLDAIGRSIDDVQKAQQCNGAAQERVIVSILTDGMENASTDFTHEVIADRIALMRAGQGWEFVYLGANQDAIAIASKMNIPARSSASFMANKAGMARAYCMMGNAVSNFRMDDMQKRDTDSHRAGADDTGSD
jgi:hypothetical protein